MSKHVLIVGAGAIGVCCGHYLAERGFRVTIVDRSDESEQGCSFGNAGMIVPSHFIPLAAPGMVKTALRMMLNPRSPFYIQPRLSSELIGWMWKFRKSANAGHVARSGPLLRDLNLASRALFLELAGQCNNDFQLSKNGLLMLCNTDAGLHEEASAAEASNQLGIAARVLDARQTAQLEPNIRMNIKGSVYFPLDCHLSPDRLMRFLRRRMLDVGGTFLWNTEIREWKTEGKQIVAAKTDDGTEIAADEFVICGGSWSPGVVGSLGLTIPMQAGKGYSLTLENPRKLPGICAVLTEGRVAVTPMGNRLRFGGTMEMSGLNQEIRPRRVEGIIRSACAYFPEFTPDDFKDIRPWCGLRPCSPDGLPYVGRTRKYDNLAIATGHAMMGISLAPITGKIISEILDGRVPGINVSDLDPDRYSKH